MITKNIATRTIREIESHFRQDWTYQDRDSFALPPIPDPEKHLCIYAADRGYLDHFYPTSLRLVRLMGHKVHVVKYIGSFVSVGSLVAVVDYQGSSKFKKALLRRLVGGGIVVREYRSFTQDINFGIRQLVDIAIKAISPAVNDPTTAVTCLNYLGEIVKEFAKYRMPSRTTEVLESSGVYIHEFTFEKVVDHAFNQIHQWGRTDCIVVRQIIHVLTDAVSGCKNPHNLAVLIQEVEEMELLSKSSAELKVLFVFDEYVTSLRESYLKRFVKTALQNIQQVTDTVAALPAADQALHQNSLSVLESKRKLLEEWLSNQRLGASPSNH